MAANILAASQPKVTLNRLYANLVNELDKNNELVPPAYIEVEEAPIVDRTESTGMRVFGKICDVAVAIGSMATRQSPQQNGFINVNVQSNQSARVAPSARNAKAEAAAAKRRNMQLAVIIGGAFAAVGTFLLAAASGGYQTAMGKVSKLEIAEKALENLKDESPALSKLARRTELVTGPILRSRASRAKWTLAARVMLVVSAVGLFAAGIAGSTALIIPTAVGLLVTGCANLFQWWRQSHHMEQELETLINGDELVEIEYRTVAERVAPPATNPNRALHPEPSAPAEDAEPPAYSRAQKK
jgi:hypothetical protein